MGADHERIECIDDRSLLVADPPHFFEADATSV